MSEHVFLYRIKNSNDRDCCAYIDANDPDFVCNHYFSSVGICGSCYSGKDWANYDDIETILTRTEYNQLLKYKKELHELGYGITRGDDRYKKGIKIMRKIKPIINKLKSDEAQEFFDRISSEEMEILKEEYELNIEVLYVLLIMIWKILGEKKLGSVDTLTEMMNYLWINILIMKNSEKM